MRPAGGQFTTVLYRGLWEEIWQFAQGLARHNLQAGDKVVILGETGYEWALTDWAAQTLGLCTIPIYPTLPADQAQYIADDSGAKLVIAQTSKLAAKLTNIPTTLMRQEEGFDWLLAPGEPGDRQGWESSIPAIDGESIATIIYTSGTTGQPKGAMLAHSAFTTLNRGIRASLPIGETDVFLSFLPLSHVYERYAGHVLPMSCGSCVAYAGSLASLAGDMVKVRPTIMLCVPRFLEATRAKILEGIKKQKPLNQKLFGWALEQGLRKARNQSAPFAGILDKLVGEKIREKTGGRMRFFVSGGAALSPHVSEFYIAFGLNVLQGYGLTETCAGTCINLPDQNEPRTVGPVIQGIDVKLAPDGEILVKGPTVMKGYHNLPKETAEVIDEEGWFHTGDIGEFEGVRLKITDRKKDILVLANGKNIAPQKIEAKLKESEFINEAVVFGDGFAYCYALIVPEFEFVKAWLAEKGEKEADPARLAARDDVRAQIKKEIDKANGALADFEKIKKHQLVGNPFTVDGGELTPSMKVKRKVVRDKYKPMLAMMEKSED
jgi:long-chain acyl-CoA synthetase